MKLNVFKKSLERRQLREGNLENGRVKQIVSRVHRSPLRGVVADCIFQVLSLREGFLRSAVADDFLGSKLHDG